MSTANFLPTEDDEISITSSLSIPSTPSPDKSAFRVHPRYYVNDELTVFLVNNEVLFRVHRHFLDRESAKFRSFPTGTDENPVHLDNIHEDEFVALLEYFYDKVHGEIVRSREEWTRLLSISHLFGMEKIHTRAIKELDFMNLDPVDRIVLAMNYDIPTWLNDAYAELCVREESLREDEAHRLGLSTTVKLACARERLRVNSQKRHDDTDDVGCHPQYISEPYRDSTPIPPMSAYDKKLQRAESIIAEIFQRSPPPFPSDDLDGMESGVPEPKKDKKGTGKKGKKR